MSQRLISADDHVDLSHEKIMSFLDPKFHGEYIDALKRELADVTKEFDGLIAKDLPALNDSLKSKGQQPISAPPTKVGTADSTPGSGGLAGSSASLSADFSISF